jgi:hypothetical protein
MSDLLNKASLVVIPSGYKEDTVYSVVPSDGSGDLSFTRASNGTRVNSAGLVEVCPWNNLTYSEDFTNAIWQKINATITANSTTAPNGTTTASTLLAPLASGNAIYEIINNAETQTFSIYAKANTSNFIYLDIFDASPSVDYVAIFDLSNGTYVGNGGNLTADSYSIESVGNGWYRISVSQNLGSASSSNNFAIGVAKTGNSAIPVANTSVYIWGAQLNIGSTAKPYFPTTDRLNVPRLTYQNGGGWCPSLLLEKQSTNLAFPSEDLTAWTSGGMTNTANQITSPDGTQNADKSTIGSTPRYYDVITSGITTVNGTTYTTSFFAKKGTGIESIYFYQGDGGRIAKWNLNNGVYIGYAPADGYTAFTSYGSESLGNGWYRFYATYTASSTSGNLTIGVSTNTNDSVTPISGNGTDFVYVWGLQYEASSYATSYIPTTSASATRVADIMEVNLPNTDMTFCAYLECEEAPLATTAGDWLRINSSVSILGRGYGYGDGIGFADAYTMGVTSATKMVWKQESGTTAKIFKNGALAATSTTGTYSDPFNRFRIDGSYLDKPLKIKEFVFFQNNLTDAECAALTA